MQELSPLHHLNGSQERFALLLRRSMEKIRPLAVAAAIAIAFVLSAGAPANAHGRLGAAEGRCRLFIGPDIMNFTGYLPEASKNEFCEDIPSTGPMIMVLDAEQSELRDMKVELRIVKDVGGEDKENENLEAVTVAYKEPKVYPNGTVNFSHTFDDPGYFVGIVTVTGDHGERWVSRFPFSVGKSFMRDLPYYSLLAMGTIAVFIIYLVHRRRSPPPQIATAAAAFKSPPIRWDDDVRASGSADIRHGASGPDAVVDSARTMNTPVPDEGDAVAEKQEEPPKDKDDDSQKPLAAE